MSTTRLPRRLFTKSLVIFGALALILNLSACGSHPIKPEGENVKITREAITDDDCKEIGPVEGRVSSANKVKIETTSGTGTAVRGTAYFCD